MDKHAVVAGPFRCSGHLDLECCANRALDCSRLGRDRLPNGQRLPWVVIGLVERERGRIEQAIETLDHVNNIPQGHVPAYSRRGVAAVEQPLRT